MSQKDLTVTPDSDPVDLPSPLWALFLSFALEGILQTHKFFAQVKAEIPGPGIARFASRF